MSSDVSPPGVANLVLGSGGQEALNISENIPLTDPCHSAIELLGWGAESNFLNRINAELASSPDVERVRKTILKDVLELLQASAAWIWLVDDATGALVCVQSLDHSGGPAPHVAEWQALAESVVTGGQPLVVPTLAAGALLGEGVFHAAGSHPASVFVPINSRGRILGVLLLVHTRAQSTIAAEIRFFESVAAATGAAFENLRIYQKAQELVLLQERRRLAASLHDAINQSLFSAGLIADALPRLVERDTARAAQSVQDLRTLLRGTVADLRALLGELQPSLITTTDFGDLLGTLATGYTGRTSTTVAVKIGAKVTFTPETQETLYRLCREAVTNIAKHADATQVWIELAPKSEGIEIVIRDNGRGMDRDMIPTGRFGLSMMEQQAAWIGAEFRIVSQIGHGTKVAVFVPRESILTGGIL